MKYRMLTEDELKPLEDELKQFLIVNGIHKEEWERLNQSDQPKAIQLVEIFSDTVLQKVYEKVDYLEFRSHDNFVLFKMDAHSISLISVQSKSAGKVNLSTPESIHQALAGSFSELDFFQAQKKYTQNRELEIHQMLEQGCVVSSKEFWEALNEVLQ